MTLFRIFLASCIITITAYTSVTVAQHGLNLFPDYLGDLQAMAWPGQFNLDFTCLLLLAGVWMAWRNQFSAGGIALGLLMPVGGMPLLSAYLLYLSFKTKGDAVAMMIGEARPGA
jgi:hypothetical protein